MALTFVGFIGGSKHFDGSLALSTLGLLKTTYYTFLPCFVLILVGAPLIERTQHIASLKAVFSIITATVGGGGALSHGVASPGAGALAECGLAAGVVGSPAPFQGEHDRLDRR